MKIIPATCPEQLRQVRQLFEAYAALLSLDLCVQDFQQELDGLPTATPRPMAAFGWRLPSERRQRVVSPCVGWHRVLRK